MATKLKEIENVLGATGRQNKYRIQFNFPEAVSHIVETEKSDIDVMAKSASAPAKEIGVIELWNQGRKLPIPGDTSFDNSWEVSFYLGETHELRYDMLKWQDACDNFYLNFHTGDPDKIFSDLTVQQLDSAAQVTAEYTLKSCWPSNVGEITYSDDAENSPTEFSVTFTYSEWVVGTGEVPDYNPKFKATNNATSFDATGTQ
jgi:hypothetical protein